MKENHGTNGNKKTEEKRNQNVGLKNIHLIMLMQQTHQLKINDQNIIQTIQKMEEKFITDARKPNFVVLNVLEIFICYIMQIVIK